MNLEAEINDENHRLMWRDGVLGDQKIHLDGSMGVEIWWIFLGDMILWKWEEGEN